MAPAHLARQLRHDAANAPDVHRRRVVRGAQQHLWRTVPQRHNLRDVSGAVVDVAGGRGGRADAHVVRPQNIARNAQCMWTSTRALARPTSCVYALIGMEKWRPRPKSATLSSGCCVLSSTSRFCGLRSRCITPCLCMCATPFSSWYMKLCSTSVGVEERQQALGKVAGWGAVAR